MPIHGDDTAVFLNGRKQFLPRIFHPIASCFACVGQVVGQMKKRRQFPFASALTFSPFAPYFLTTLRSIRNQKFEHLTQKTAENGGFPKKIGPSDRIRTCGILLPKQARYQLRYTRLFSFFRVSACIPKAGALPSALHPVIWFLSGWAYSPKAAA